MTTLLALITSYGYVVLLLVVMLESLGLPLPGETALLAAAALAASGRLSIVGVVLAAAAGAIIGDAGGYWIGRTGGLALVRRYGRWLHVDDAKLRRAETFFQRHGAKTVFLGRFVALLRMVVAVLAGVAHMPYGRFTFFNVLGGVCWATGVGALGYLFGRNLPTLERALGRAGWLVALLLALIVGLVLLGRWIMRHRTDLWSWANRRRQLLLQAPAVRSLQRRYPAAWAFLGRRLSRGGYLGLHLTVGLLFSIGTLLVFGMIAEDVAGREDLTQFDLTLASTLHLQATATGLAIFRVITTFGSVAWMAALVGAVALVLLWNHRWLLLGGWLAAELGGGLLNAALKMFFQRPRPQFSVPYVTATGWGFPSGHAMGSLIGYGLLAYLLILVVHRRSVRVLIASCAALLVLLIGVSRIYLGAHYFSDVVAGYAAGGVWLAACISGLEVARHSPGRATRLPT